MSLNDMFIIYLNVTHLKGGYNVPNVYKHTDLEEILKNQNKKTGTWVGCQIT